MLIVFIVLFIVGGILALVLAANLWFYTRSHRINGGPDPVGKGITLLVPFTSDDGRRQRTWKWLRKFYEAHLPGVQIVVQGNNNVPFCKTAAVNDAFLYSTGDVIVLLDADCYIDPKILLECANEIRQARAEGNKLWYIPYREFNRVNKEVSDIVLGTNPSGPFLFSGSLPKDETTVYGTSNGHWFGALIQVMPIEAFKASGGMDERFAGWGGEDVAFMRCVDTMYAKHKTLNRPVFHLWHPSKPNPRDDHLRIWDGQGRADQEANDQLLGRYYAAFGDKKRMRRLVGEHSWLAYAYPGKRKIGRS